ncbi:MAG: hypothetical protein ACYSSI_08725, partial [Planctomycetota bacterium]
MATKFGKDRPLRKFKWQIIVICVVVAAVSLIMILTDAFAAMPKGLLVYLLWFLILGLMLITVIALLSKVTKILKALEALPEISS